MPSLHRLHSGGVATAPENQGLAVRCIPSGGLLLVLLIGSPPVLLPPLLVIAFDSIVHVSIAPGAPGDSVCCCWELEPLPWVWRW